MFEQAVVQTPTKSPFAAHNIKKSSPPEKKQKEK
jgi:hypothetical protein